jgi:hypothetical protein
MLFAAVHESDSGPSRHFAPRINCVALARSGQQLRGSRDPILGCAFDKSGSQAAQERPRRSPRKPDGRHVPPDDSAESTGERLEARYPGSRTGYK